MKPLAGLRIPIIAVSLLLLSALAVAQDADKQKLIEIEKAFAAHPNPGPETAAVLKQYLFDGTNVQLTTQGQVGALPKSRILEFFTKPNPADPNFRSTQSVSDFHVEMYGETALVGYKVTNTDTGHKDPALNATDHYSCLDTFVKRAGQWTIVGYACSPSEPLPQAEWNAAKKAMSEMPKDVKDAYH
jgi:hypothetical protein